jgi:hypothetical protein
VPSVLSTLFGPTRSAQRGEGVGLRGQGLKWESTALAEANRDKIAGMGNGLIRLGTSAFTAAGWPGSFYPANLRPGGLSFVLRDAVRASHNRATPRLG